MMDVFATRMLNPMMHNPHVIINMHAIIGISVYVRMRMNTCGYTVEYAHRCMVLQGGGIPPTAPYYYYYLPANQLLGPHHRDFYYTIPRLASLGTVEK